MADNVNSSNIASSVILSTSPQSDGRAWVTEQHTDVAGIAYPVTYLAAQGADLQTALASHASALSDQLTQTEISANLAQVVANGSAATVTFTYSTQGQSIAAMAQQYAALGPWEVVLLGEFLAALPEADQTGQIGLTAPQIAALQSGVAAVQTAQAALAALIAPIAAGMS